MNYAIIVGKIIEVPTLKETTQGVKFTTLLVEADRNFRNADGELESDLIQISLWRGIAEEAHLNAKTGQYVAIKARIQTKCYQSEQGNTFYNYEFHAEKISFLK